MLTCQFLSVKDAFVPMTDAEKNSGNILLESQKLNDTISVISFHFLQQYK